MIEDKIKEILEKEEERVKAAAEKVARERQVPLLEPKCLEASPTLSDPLSDLLS